MTNAHLVVCFKFSWMFIPIISVLIPFATGLGISMRDFFLLQSFFGLVVTLAEVPSGYIADLFGRKVMMVIGGFLSGLGFTVLAFSTNLFHLFIYEGIVGLSLSFISGADYSLMFDSLKESAGGVANRKLQALWTSRFAVAGLVGEASSAVLGGFLGLYNLRYVVVATAVCGWLPLLFAFFFKEPEIKRMNKDSHKENFLKVLNHLFIQSSFLKFLIINFTIWSLSTMCAVWLIQKYWLMNDLSLFWCGILWAVYSLVAAVMSHYSHKLEEIFGTKKYIMFFALFVSFTYMSLFFIGFKAGLIVLSFFYIVRGALQPVFREGFNHRINEEYRATANSILSLSFRLSFMVIGPLLGWYVDMKSVNELFLILGILFFILFITVLWPFLKMEERA